MNGLSHLEYICHVIGKLLLSMKTLFKRDLMYFDFYRFIYIIHQYIIYNNMLHTLYKYKSNYNLYKNNN